MESCYSGPQQRFFSFFCAGEITVPTASSFDPVVHLAWGNISISDDSRMLRVFLKHSKTDQYGRGVEIFIGRTGDLLCPVEAVSTYVSCQGSIAGLFFRSEDGVLLMKAQFVGIVRSALVRASVSVLGYSVHSFRIGAATAAAEAGIPDSTIQALGHWLSSAFLSYHMAANF